MRNFWSNLLWLSGGLLELDKCSFHHLHFDFAPDGSAALKSGIFGEPLQVQDKRTEKPVTISAKLVYTPHKTLGHHKALAGNNWTQLQVLCANSDVYAKLVSTSPCNWTDLWYFYMAIYLKSLGYVFPNCFFSIEKLTKVQQAALCAFLAKCGYNRNAHCAIVFAPL
jgi:hypothetical protein